MSEETAITSVDQLPIIPETQIIEPIIQCGVLYLGTAPPTPGHRGLDSIQEPFSRRYPVDGTNTVRGIDAVLSIYDNGIQLALARQPHTVIFYPISSLIYCASLRFSVIEHDQTSSIDWRFTTLDPKRKNRSKHPPLFCFVVQRTQVSSGDECHCFITKDDESALALVRTISEIYANVKSNFKLLKSPIFYQLDRYGRKLSETNGIIYISPAIDDEYQLNQITDLNDSISSSINRNYLLDPSSDGFFYRTNASIIEQWQLWDDIDVNKSRPRPPNSPFGLHQGLYHDDLSQEMHQYLNHMDNDKESSSSCSCSSSSSSIMKYDRHHRKELNVRYDVDQSNTTSSHSQTSSFDPYSVHNNMEIKRLQQAPIVIEKVLPNPMIMMPEKRSKYILEQSQESFDYSTPIQQEIHIDYIPIGDAYQINRRGEKITKEGNRIMFTDVIQPNLTTTNNIESKSNTPPKSDITPKARSHRRRTTQIPVIDLQYIQNLCNERKFKQRQTSIDSDEKPIDDYHLTTSDMLEIVEEYFEDYKGREIKLNNRDTPTMLNHLELLNKNEHQEENNSINKTYHHHRRQNHSKLISDPSLNYVERSSIKLRSKQTLTDSKRSNPHILNNEHVSNIYGTSKKKSRSIKSSTLSTKHHESQISNDTNTVDITNSDYISPFRYAQSTINPLLLREYRKTFNGI
ncbi:unnamed protein product [Rotaria sordida]|uniref:PID domain-containing protein n=1 Tax=Rotaria sordida TaxID=392033 RepID=A0A819FSE4_9BILA|nr:unnamed protein product [Rotaria sordida]CAF3872110.1 unnamed protein product [Rotaria sordida]